MITTAAKWFFGLGLVSFVLAVVYGYSTGGNRLGPFTAGYYGAVGDHLGYTLLAHHRDRRRAARPHRGGHPRRRPQGARRGRRHRGRTGRGAAGLPVALAAGRRLRRRPRRARPRDQQRACSWSARSSSSAVLVEWMVLAWSDHATGDPETNHLAAPAHHGALRGAPRRLPARGRRGGRLLPHPPHLVVARRGRGSPSASASWSSRSARSSPCGRTCPTTPSSASCASSPSGVVVAGVASAARGERFIEPHEEHHAEEEERGEAERRGRRTSPRGTRRSRPRAPKSVTTTTVAEGEG